jgi:hypothetical protein
VNCLHERVVETRTRGYAGPVSREENRAAHGGVCITERCRECGAERSCNVNGRHHEAGPWGPTLAERQGAARAARAAVPAPPPPLCIDGPGYTRTRIFVDDEGMIVCITDPGTVRARLFVDDKGVRVCDDSRAVMLPFPEGWLSAALAVRTAVLVALAAESKAV